MSGIKLKAKRKNTDDWLLFGITELFHGENGYSQVCVEDVGLFAIDPATIQLADLDPHLVALMEGLEIPGPDFWSNRDPGELKLVGKAIAKQAKSAPGAPQPADDPRKAMLDEIRKQIDGFRFWTNYEGSVDFLVSRSQVEILLDEMEAKL